MEWASPEWILQDHSAHSALGLFWFIFYMWDGLYVPTINIYPLAFLCLSICVLSPVRCVPALWVLWDNITLWETAVECVRSCCPGCFFPSVPGSNPLLLNFSHHFWLPFIDRNVILRRRMQICRAASLLLLLLCQLAGNNKRQLMTQISFPGG